MLFRKSRGRPTTRRVRGKRSFLWLELLEPRAVPSTIWSQADVPAVASVQDPNPIELGVKFRSDVAGYVTGVNFYKGPTNTGTHTGHLWTSTGTLLATVTFSGETATGWQHADFPAPVSIAAGTTYVVSYYTTSGNYAASGGYFAAGANNAPLHALASGVDGPDGLYRYGPDGFPAQSYNATNYWVDVVFSAVDNTPLTVVGESPPAGSSPGTAVNAVTATFSKSVRASSLAFTLAGPGNSSVPAAVSYNDLTHTATLTPTTPLAAGTTYTATVSAAQDLGGLALAAPVSWSFSTPDASRLGQWSQPVDWPLVTVNAVLLGTSGKLLVWDGGGDCIGGPSARVWDPATGNFTPVPVDSRNDTNDIFCAGTVSMADGRVLVVGGHDCSGVGAGIYRSNIFDPATMQWTAGPDMHFARWYPTATTLPDGRVLVTSGSDLTQSSFVQVPEVYDPATNTFTPLDQATQYVPAYPFMYVLPDGRVLDAGANEYDSTVSNTTPTRVLDPKTWTWTTVDARPIDGGSSVMYLPGKVMKAGSAYEAGAGRANDPLTGSGAASANTAYTLDMTGPSPQWQPTGGMAFPRTFGNLTILPTGAVLATGGSTTHDPVNLANAVYAAESWDPNTGTWSTLAADQVPRLYHSTAILLPDGRVLVAGGGRDFGQEQANELNAEIYSPPYLFKGARPTIASAPAAAAYGTSFVVQTPDAANIASVSLVRPGSVTHSVNMDQRLVPLAFQQTTGGLTVQAPADANTAPPGYYMLFIVNRNGVPSVAAFVQLKSPAVVATTPAFAADGVATATRVTATFSAAMDPATLNVSTFQLLDPAGRAVSGTVAYDAATMTATLTLSAQLQPATTYTAVVHGGSAGPRAADPAGNALAADFRWSFTTALAATGPFSVWSDSALPQVAAASDGGAIELGMRFQTDVAGTVTGLRFYKGSGNTGTHVGHLWTDAGVLLASATFTGESGSGWQTVMFASPVAVNPNTTYVASYFAPYGHYAASAGYFQGGTRATPLYAPATG